MPYRRATPPGKLSARPPLGSSLIELILVMAIVSVLAAIAVPRYSAATADHRLNVAAQRLADDLAYAGVLARVMSTEVKVRFKDGDRPDESRYWFEGIDDPDHPGRDYTVVLREEPYRVILDNAPGDLVFDIYGMPRDTKEFRLEIGEERRVVQIDKTTGQVTIE